MNSIGYVFRREKTQCAIYVAHSKANAFERNGGDKFGLCYHISLLRNRSHISIDETALQLRISAVSQYIQTITSNFTLFHQNAKQLSCFRTLSFGVKKACCPVRASRYAQSYGWKARTDRERESTKTGFSAHRKSFPASLVHTVGR